MAYADLNQEQKDQLAGWERTVRGAMGELQRLLDVLTLLRNEYWANPGGIAQLFNIPTLWPDGEVIPNSSGLAGSAPQTKLDFINLVSQMDGLLADGSAFTSGFDTTALQQQRVLASGPQES